VDEASPAVLTSVFERVSVGSGSRAIINRIHRNRIRRPTVLAWNSAHPLSPTTLEVHDKLFRNDPQVKPIDDAAWLHTVYKHPR